MNVGPDLDTKIPHFFFIQTVWHSDVIPEYPTPALMENAF